MPLHLPVEGAPGAEDEDEADDRDEHPDRLEAVGRPHGPKGHDG